MLRLSKLTDYGVVVLVQLGTGERVQTAPHMSRATGVPEPTVAKVLKALAAAGLVCSQRGARGGYRLSRPLGEMPVAAVITAIDGPVTMTACVEGGHSACEASSRCPVHGRWDQVNRAIRQVLMDITLADMQPVPPAPAATILPVAAATMTISA